MLETIEQYPTRLQNEAGRRHVIIDRWKASGNSAHKFSARLRNEGRNCCRATLYNWQRRYDSMGLVGLIDGRDRKVAQARAAWAKAINARMDRLCGQLDEYAQRLDARSLEALVRYGEFLAHKKKPKRPPAGPFAIDTRGLIPLNLEADEPASMSR